MYCRCTFSLCSVIHISPPQYWLMPISHVSLLSHSKPVSTLAVPDPSHYTYFGSYYLWLEWERTLGRTTYKYMYVLLVHLFPVFVYVLETCFFRVTFFGPILCHSHFDFWVLGWTEHVLWYFVLQRGTEFQDILGLLRSLWWVGGLASSSFPGGSRRPNQTCWYYTRFLFSGLMSDFCINAYNSVTSYCLSHANH